VGGGNKVPPPSYNFFGTNKIKSSKMFDYISVDNHQKMTKIGKNGKKCFRERITLEKQ
jgi:hypothetical protein